MFLAALQKHACQPGQTALLTPDGAAISYQRLLQQTAQINQRLGKRKQLIFIHCQQNPATIYAIAAILCGNHAALLLPQGIDAQALQRLIDNYQPNHILRTTQACWEIQTIHDKPLDIHPDLCLLLSTSGSTGSPKQVRLSRQNLYANARAINRYLRITGAERAITSLPLSYAYGLSVLTTHLLAGASLLVTDSTPVHRDFWRQLEQFQITSLAGVPYTYQLLRRLGFFRKRLPYLTTLTQAGGKLAKDLVLSFASYAQQQRKRFFVMYGQTEATARMAYLEPEQALARPQSIGKAIHQGRFSLLDTEQQPVTTAHTMGELIYEGPNVMMGYAQTCSDLALGKQLKWLHTGDLAYFDEQGYYYICGRKSRFIKIFGKRINLDEVERYLQTQSYRVICSGRDDLLLVVSEQDCDTDALIKIVSEYLSVHHSAVQAHICREIPLTNNGKPDYPQLVTRYLSEPVD